MRRGLFNQSESPSARPPEAGLIPSGDRLRYTADEGLS